MTTSPSFEESSDLFHSESNQLESNINSALNKHERLPISEIVEIHYQVIKVGSISKLLKEMSEVTGEGRSARFRTIALIAWEDGAETSAEGVVEGIIAATPSGVLSLIHISEPTRPY